MARLLHRLGCFAYRRRLVVVVAWVVALAALGVAAATLSRPTSLTVSIPGTESQQAIDLLAQRMPEAAVNNATARIVFTAKGSGKVTDPARMAAIKRAVRKVSSLPHVQSVLDPATAKAISLDQRTAIANVVYDVESREVTDAERQALESAGRAARSAGLEVEFGGSALTEFALSHYSEIVAVGIAALVLLITFGSLVAAGMPLVTAGAGVISGLLGIEIVTRFTDLQWVTFVLALMLGLAVGIDYALFVVSRYRHELIVGRSGEEAAGRAVATAGSAVLFAGLTVVIALLALVVAGIPFMTTMGVAAAGTVLATVLAALTLLPAVLGLVGEHVLGRRGRAAHDTEGDVGRPPLGERWARLLVRFRVPAVAVTVVALIVCALPARDLTLGMTNDSSAPSGSTQHVAYEQIAKAFGPGVNGPLVVAVDLEGSDHPKGAARTIQREVGTLPGVFYALAPTLNQARDTAIITLIPSSGPSDQATSDLVKAIRSHASSWQKTTGAQAFVTGETAVAIDTSAKLQAALIPYLAVIVVLAFLLLMVVFRSLLVPLKAVAGFLLSVLATFGIVVAVFQWGWWADLLGVTNPAPIIAFAPIFLIGILFGLAMDYEVFLVTRIREEHMRGDPANVAIVTGFRHGARVVVAAAAIMISVFGGFVLQSDATIKTIGFAFAVGVFIDAFLIRMTFGPAVLSLLGERAWRLPAWLDRILPNVDVEGLNLPDPPAGTPGETRGPVGEMERAASEMKRPAAEAEARPAK